MTSGTLSSRCVPVVLFTLLAAAVVTFAGFSDKMESDFFNNPETTVQLYHYFGDEEPSPSAYKSRGTIVIKNFKGPRYTSTQTDLTDQDIRQIQKLSDSDGHYFIKSIVKTETGEKTFQSFSSASALLQSGLSDILRVHVKPNGDILAVDYSLARADFASSLKRAKPLKFNTTVVIHHGELGPQPDTAPYLEKLEQERMAKERGEDPRDNRSFLAKYWMYIVPIAIMVLLSGASNPEEGAGR